MWVKKRKINAFLASFILMSILYSNCGPAMEANTQSFSNTSFENNQLYTGDPHGTTKLVKQAYVQPLFMNRTLTFNVFKDIFGTEKIFEFNRDIAHASTDFGMGYGIYEGVSTTTAACNAHTNPYYACNENKLDLQSKPTFGANAPREARRMSACERGLNDDKSFEHALKKISSDASLAEPPQMNMKNYQRLFELFFRGRPLPDETFFDNFTIVSNRESDKTEAWRKIILGVCLSPHWQVL